MTSRERLADINGLRFSDKIIQMDEQSFQTFCNALNLFIDSYPGYETDIRNAFDQHDDYVLIKNLKKLSDLLVLIGADELAQSCLRVENEISLSDREPLRSRLTFLLTTAAGLSINIQMALSGDVQAVSQVCPAHTDKTIMVVDDVSFVLKTLQLVINDTGYKYIGLTSGDDALAYLASHTHRPDLYILDIEMPEMNGYELADKIRELGEVAPIIFLTGNATKDYVFKAIQAGAADFIVKPFNKEQVLNRIYKFMRL